MVRRAFLLTSRPSGQAVKLAGLAGNVTPHTLRHTKAT